MAIGYMQDEICNTASFLRNFKNMSPPKVGSNLQLKQRHVTFIAMVSVGMPFSIHK